jgi:hypothetical protein
MTLSLASQTMQGMAVVFMTTCLTLRALRLLETTGLLVSVAMGSVLIACAGVLARNVYMAVVMFAIHLVSALLVVVVTREGGWRLCRRHG